MSEPAGSGPAGDRPADGSRVRIGTIEREAALKALELHLTAGRLELDEYGERSAKVSLARTIDELTPLFADLPLPHAVSAASPAAPAAQRSASWRQARVGSSGPIGGPLFGRFGETLVALSPFIALGLFFGFGHHWWVYLLIPVVGAIVYGNHKDARNVRRRLR